MTMSKKTYKLSSILTVRLTEKSGVTQEVIDLINDTNQVSHLVIQSLKLMAKVKKEGEIDIEQLLEELHSELHDAKNYKKNFKLLEERLRILLEDIATESADDIFVGKKKNNKKKNTKPPKKQPKEPLILKTLNSMKRQ